MFVVTRGFLGSVNLLPTRGYIAGVSTTVIDTHDGAEWHRRKKHQAKLAEEAIYRKAPRAKLTLKNPLRIDETKPKVETVSREITVAPFIYEIGRMPLANPDQWLLDDDEEAIIWLLQ